MEYPGNMMTPDVCILVPYLKTQCADRLNAQVLCRRIRNEADGQKGVEVIIRDEGMVFGLRTLALI